MKGSIDRTMEEEKNGSKKLLLGFLSENTATSGKLSYPELIANSANLLYIFARDCSNLQVRRDRYSSYSLDFHIISSHSQQG